jgi:hypothetical protein
MHVFKMAAVVGGSNPVCVAAAALSLECVAEMRNTGHVGAKYALAVSLVFEAFK